MAGGKSDGARVFSGIGFCVLFSVKICVCSAIFGINGTFIVSAFSDLFHTYIYGISRRVCCVFWKRCRLWWECCGGRSLNFYSLIDVYTINATQVFHSIVFCSVLWFLVNWLRLFTQSIKFDWNCVRANTHIEKKKRMNIKASDGPFEVSREHICDKSYWLQLNFQC